jgi:hypothetical protein
MAAAFSRPGCDTSTKILSRVLYRVYHTDARDKDVWSRLMSDTATRKGLPCKQYSYLEGSTAVMSGPEGWAQNVVTRTVTQPPKESALMDAPLDSWHPTKLQKCRRAEPLQFYAAIRPTTHTVNQTLRCALMVVLSEGTSGRFYGY